MAGQQIIGYMVSPTVGQAALKLPNVRIEGMPGFGVGQIYTFDGGPHVGYITYSFGDEPTAKVESASTGVAPTETSYALYGHVVPLSLGKVRIGGEIIGGPWVENGKASFCISFGVPVDPYDTRTLKEIAFDSEVVWENGAFNVEAFTFRFYPGTLTQAADPLETSHFGVDAIAYRPQILLWFENLLIENTKFKKIPYVAAVIEDSSAGEVNWGNAFEALAYSPWVGYTADQFETVDVTDGVSNGGLIIAQDAEFLSTIQQFGRFFRNWNILQTDKLRIVDRGAAVSADISLNRTTLSGQIVFARGETSTIPRVLELSTIDPDADYTVVPSQAVRPREPVNVTASVSTETVYLPIVMDSSTRQSLVTYTKYQEEVARKKVTGTAMMHGFEIEPGDLVAITGLGDDFEDTTFKIIETLHGSNYTVEFTAEAFMDCGFSGDPHWAGVVLLLGFEGADGSTGAPGLTDESSRMHGTGEAEADAQVDVARFKFGAASLKLDGITDLVRFPPSSDWCLSPTTADVFTVECWVEFSVLNSTNQLVGWSFTSLTWRFLATSSGELQFQSSSNGTTYNVSITSSGAGLLTNVWYHLAVDKDATGKIRLYKNGVMFGSATPSVSSQFNGSSNYLLVGGDALVSTVGVNGWLDEVRLTKGICRYGSDGGFAVPTSAYPRGGI